MTDARRPTPSVRTLLTRFAMVAFVILGTSLALGKFAIDIVIREVEREQISDDLTRARLTFERVARRARQQAQDYAFWDEAVRLTQNPDARAAPGFFRRNFAGAIPRTDYQFIELLDDKGASVFHWSEFEDLKRPAIVTNPAFLKRVALERGVGGYVRDGDALYLIAGSTVHPSMRTPTVAPPDSAHAEGAATFATAPVRGYLVLGRVIRGRAQALIARDLQFGLGIYPADYPLPDTPLHAERYANDDSVRAFLSLTDVTGRRAAVIALQDTRRTLHRLSRWTVYGVFAYLLLSAGGFLFIWLYGRRLLVKPLNALSLEIVAMHGRGELSEIASSPPSEEWALFLSTFNDTVRSLRDSEQRYGALFHRSVDPYFLYESGTGRVVDANPAAVALTGEPRERLVGASLPDALRTSPDTGDAIRVRRPDGTVRTWGVAETEVTLGERRLVLAAYRDLTDRELLAHSQKMDAIGSLAGGVAHDFNNLMGAILAGVRAARQETVGGPHGRAALDAIEHAGRRAAELTRQLLGVGRQQPLARVPIDVGAAIANIARMCKSTFGPRIRIVTTVPPDLPAVEGDPGQLEQALLNLCLNARDAMPQGGTLCLSARVEEVDTNAALTIRDIQPGRCVVIDVADSGVGMHDDVKQRIFEPFYTTKASGKGTGLGLAVVHGFVRGVGGTIVVDSTPGSGTRFALYFPASRRDPATVPPARHATPPGVYTSGSRRVILLADDELNLRAMLRLVLEHEGYTLLEAANGEEAVVLVEQHAAEIDVVLLDMQMPVLSGLEAFARIRALAPTLPIIMGTGFIDDAESTAFREAGADDYILKPYEIRDLLERLTRLTTARTPAKEGTTDGVGFEPTVGY